MLITKILRRLWIWLSYIALVVFGFISFLFFMFPFNFTRVRGKKHVPKQGEHVLYVANHRTMFDSFLIGVAAYFPLYILFPSYPFMNFAARENFFRGPFFKALFALLRTVPVERRDHPWLMRKYVKFLEKRNLLIFYQGTRSDDLSIIRKGPAFAIMHSKSPIKVIPVYHEGIDRIFSRGGPNTHGIWCWLPRSLFRRPTVIFGESIDFSDLSTLEPKEQAEAINQRIILRITKLKEEFEQS